MRRTFALPPACTVAAVAASLLAACGGGGGGSGGTGGTPDVPPPLPAVRCPAPLTLADVSHPTTVVGDGTSASCTEARFAAALAAGGVITFACGEGPATITLTSEKQVRLDRDTVIDGGGTVTLSGGGQTRLLAVRGDSTKATPVLRLQRLTLRDGKGSGAETQGGGGAVYLFGGSLEAVDCRFTGNAAVQSGPDVAGGAIYERGVGDIRAVGTVFQGNSAASGGAIGALAASVTAVNCTFTSNTASGPGDPNGGNGGAIYMDGEHRDLVVCGSTFTANKAGNLGSAIFRTAYHTEPTTLEQSVFQGNSSPRAALYFMGTAVTVKDSTVAGNTSQKGWGGFYLSSHQGAAGAGTFTNVTIAGNDAGSALGGALWVGDAGTPVTLTHVTIAGNRALFDAIAGDGASAITYRDTLVAGNVATNDWNPVSCKATGAGAVMQWPAKYGNGGIDDVRCAPSTTFQNPLLQPLATNDGPTPTMALGAGSPAIGKGTYCTGEFATDQRGHARPATGCALGAYEP